MRQRQGRRVTMTKKVRNVLLGFLAAAPAMLPSPGVAHRDVRLSICIPYYAGSECAKRGEAPSYIYGQRITVRGRARPAHEGQIKIQRRLGRQPWKTVARVRLVEGRYRYVWQTYRKHADQDTPYRFRAWLPHHDHSRTQSVYVLYGE